MIFHSKVYHIIINYLLQCIFVFSFHSISSSGPQFCSVEVTRGALTNSPGPDLCLEPGSGSSESNEEMIGTSEISLP